MKRRERPLARRPEASARRLERQVRSHRRRPEVFLEGVTLAAGATLSLSSEEAKHVRARRLRDGDEVVVLDGRGARVPATLTSGGTAVTLAALVETPGAPGASGEPFLRVTVLLACAEPARVEWAVEKGTECGAAGFVLLACERSQRAHVAALSSPARLERLRRVAREAVKQCGRSVIPEIEGPRTVGGFLGMVTGPRGASLLVADPAGASSRPTAQDGPAAARTQAALSSSEESPGGSRFPRPAGASGVLLAIGPEGGFSPAELALFAERGASFVSLGPRILRLETAVVVALARLVDPV